MLIKKTIDDVKERAEFQNFLRNSPERYKEVKSKVARNLKV
jgi:hypothetical protein